MSLLYLGMNMENKIARKDNQAPTAIGGVSRSALPDRVEDHSFEKLDKAELTNLHSMFELPTEIEAGDIKNRGTKPSSDLKIVKDKFELDEIGTEDKPLEASDLIYLVKDKKDFSRVYVQDGANLAKQNLKGLKFTRAVMPGLILSDANLEKANFSRAKLRSANLKDANLSDSKLAGASLGHADLSRAVLENADFTKASLSNAKLGRARATRVNLSRADLSAANLERAILEEADLSDANLSAANFSRAKLAGANLRGAIFTKDTNFKDACLNGVDLTRVNLNDLYLDGVDLSGAILNEAQMKNTSLVDAELNAAELNDVNLEESKLNKAELGAAKLNNAKLNKVELGDIEAKGIQLNGALIQESNFDRAFMDGASLDRSRLSKTSLKAAKLRDSKMRLATLGSVDLSQADLSNSNLDGTKLDRGNYSEANFEGASMGSANLELENYARSRFKNINFSGASLAFDPSSKLKEGQLGDFRKSTFIATKWQQFNNKRSNLNNLDFRDSYFRDCSFSGNCVSMDSNTKNFQGARYVKGTVNFLTDFNPRAAGMMEVEPSDWTRINLKNFNFSVKSRDGNFKYDLQGADFNGSDLSGAILRDRDFATFSREGLDKVVSWKNVDITGAKNVPEFILKSGTRGIPESVYDRRSLRSMSISEYNSGEARRRETNSRRR